MYAKITLKDDRETNIPIIESDKPDYKYKLKSRRDGLHFKSKKSVETFLERKFKNRTNGLKSISIEG